MGDWYNGGTIAVENGSASIVGTTTLFNTKIKLGDSLVTLQSDVLRINQVIAIDDDNNLTIDPPWAGTTDSGLSYNVIPTSRLWGDTSTAARDLSTFLANIATFFPTDGKPTDDEGGDGSFAVDPNATPPKLYLKSSGSWDDGTSLGGPMGATGAGYGGTSTDTKTLVNSGSMSWNTQTTLAWLPGSRIRAASQSAPSTKWMELICTGYAAGVLTGTITDQGPGTGSASDWTFSAAGIHGEKGDTGAKGDTGNTGTPGAAGAGYGAQSTTSRAIANTGTMTWNIGLNKAFQNGDLVKCVVPTDPTQWMKGIVSGNAAGVLSVDINEKGPASSGTFANWNIGLAGETGATGAKGDKGDTGSAGTSGSILTATSTTSVTPATGDKTFTLTADANLLVNQRVRIASQSTPGNFMSGLVKSINHSTLALVVTVDLLGPSTATASDWTISITGEKGDQGPAGGFGSLLATKGNWPIADGTAFGALPVGANGSLPVANSSAPYGVSWTAADAIHGGGYWSSTDLPSAATADLSSVPTPSVNITGSTAITSFGTGANLVRLVRFAASLTLTYNGTSLILPGSANIITQAGDCGIFASDGSGNWRCLAWTPVGYLPRERLTADRTYYVRTDGSDSNTGRSNSSGGAFLTLQRAENVARTLDFNGFTVTVRIGNGTYTAGVGVGAKVGQAGPTSLIFTSDSGVAANVIVSVTSNNAFACGYSCFISNLTITTSGTFGSAIVTTAAGTTVYYSGVVFGSCVGPHIAAGSGGVLNAVGPTSITGGSPQGHWAVSAGGTIIDAGQTITITGTPAFTGGFAIAASGSMQVNANSFSGSATGPRYSATACGVIQTFGSGPNYLPGNSAGSQATGGQYI